MSLLRTIKSLVGWREKATDCGCPEGLPGQDATFSAAVTALGAKLARADGQAEHSEFHAFSEVFQPNARAMRDVKRLYELARQTTSGFESYAKQIAKRYKNCPGLLEDVLDGLFHIAKADGAVTHPEVSYLERVAELFGLSPLTFRRLKATHLGAANDDPYVILGLAPDASDETVRAAWREQLSQSHPDRARSRGLPPEFVEVAEAKAASINAAYDQIVRERRAMRLEGAA